MDPPSVVTGRVDPGQVDVLVVDDDPNLRTSFVCILRDAGYSVDEAEDGFVALDRLKTKSIGAIVLDVVMPVLDGLQLLDRLDEPPPVVLVTALAYGEEIMLRRDKVFMYIQKPVRSLDLIEAVSRAMTTGNGAKRSTRSLTS